MAKNKVIKEQKLTYQELSELFDEISSQLDYYVHYEQNTSRELTYLKNFIRFKHLDLRLHTLRSMQSKIQMRSYHFHI